MTDNFDASDFGNSDEHIPFEIDDDYLDELHPEMGIDEEEEIDYIEVVDSEDAFTVLGSWADVSEED